MRSTTLTKKNITIIKSISRFISLFGINYLIFNYVALPLYGRILIAVIINICVFNISIRCK